MSQVFNLSIEDEYDNYDECVHHEEYEQCISNKALENIRNLPYELKSIIFYFIPLSSIRTNEAKLIVIQFPKHEQVQSMNCKVLSWK